MRFGVKIRNAVLLTSGLVMLWQASTASPLFDEPGHIVSGLLAVRNGDTGVFKVNPPLHKLWSAVFVELFHAPKLPPTVSSKEFSNLSRPEAELGENLIRLNSPTFRDILLTARIVRIPIVLLGGIFIWHVLCSVDNHSRSIACLLWASSPLVLGHGWVVSADAFSGVAMSAIVLASLNWLRNRSWTSLLLVGICWGVGLSTKFTFCLIFICFPISILAYALAGERFDWSDALALGGAYIVQGVVALLVVYCAYGFSDIGVPLRDHDLNSHLLGWMSQAGESNERASPTIKEFLVGLNSPFPVAFLTGIDQQLHDMAQPRGAYFMGSHYAGPLNWYYVLGYPIREQLAVWVAVLICTYRIVRVAFKCLARDGGTTIASSESKKVTLFVASLAVSFFLVMSMHAKLVWNIRYLLPGLPLIYILVGLTMPQIRLPFALTRRRINVLPLVLTVIVLAEAVSVTPYQFSYVNPMFGGMYQNPPAFHDSNFDYGQNLWHLEEWLRVNETDRALTNVGAQDVFVLLSGPGSAHIESHCQIATRAIIQLAIATREYELNHESDGILIVSRGFVYPEPWYSKSSPFGRGALSIDALDDVQELLRHKPHVFISPTIGGYFLSFPDVSDLQQAKKRQETE